MIIKIQLKVLNVFVILVHIYFEIRTINKLSTAFNFVQTIKFIGGLFFALCLIWLA